MIDFNQLKFVSITPPAIKKGSGDWTTNEIDTLGFDRADIVVFLGSLDTDFEALYVTHSDVAGSGHAAITGANFATGTYTNGVAAALPSGGNDNQFFHVGIDLKNKKRYLDLVATAGTSAAGTYMVAWCVLSRAEQAPNSLTERGYIGEIEV